MTGIRTAIMNGITNSAAEGLNSKIEIIKHSACGFKNKNCAGPAKLDT